MSVLRQDAVDEARLQNLVGAGEGGVEGSGEVEDLVLVRSKVDLPCAFEGNVRK